MNRNDFIELVKKELGGEYFVDSAKTDESMIIIKWNKNGLVSNAIFSKEQIMWHGLQKITEKLEKQMKYFAENEND